jgi:hypothetical protein
MHRRRQNAYRTRVRPILHWAHLEAGQHPLRLLHTLVSSVARSASAGASGLATPSMPRTLGVQRQHWWRARVPPFNPIVIACPHHTANIYGGRVYLLLIPSSWPALTHTAPPLSVSTTTVPIARTSPPWYDDGQGILIVEEAQEWQGGQVLGGEAEEAPRSRPHCKGRFSLCVVLVINDNLYGLMFSLSLYEGILHR